MRVGGGEGWGMVRVGHDGKVSKDGRCVARVWQVFGRCVAALGQDFTLF